MVGKEDALLRRPGAPVEALVRVACPPHHAHREIEGLRHLQVDLEIALIDLHRAHVGIQVGDVHAPGQGLLDLSSIFGADILDKGAPGEGFPGRGQEAFGA
jgi:hypothetical protein